MGWCHCCGTLQLLSEAALLVVPWMDGELRECCVVCGTDEPWEYAVFPMPEVSMSCAAARHVTWGPPVCETCGAGRELLVSR